MDKPDVRGAVEWAWNQMDNCIVRNDLGIATKIDFALATSEDPPGGKQMLDYAFNNRAAFCQLVVKMMGDEDVDEEIVTLEIKSQAELKRLLKRFEKAKK